MSDALSGLRELEQYLAFPESKKPHYFVQKAVIVGSLALLSYEHHLYQKVMSLFDKPTPAAQPVFSDSTYICMIPSPDGGESKTVTIDTKGDDSPEEISLLLNPDPKKAVIILRDGVNDYNELAGQNRMVVRIFDDKFQVVDRIDGVINSTEEWGMNESIVMAYEEDPYKTYQG